MATAIGGLVNASARLGGGLAGVEGPPLAGVDLENQVARSAESLRVAGLGGARIALALADSRALAVSLLATMLAGTAAPLNPAYRIREFRILLQDLHVEAVAVDRVGGAHAAIAARSLGIPVLEIQSRQQGDFIFTRCDGQPPARRHGRRRDGIPGRDVVLLLHTSGTTARPKIVPLTEQQLCAACHNVSRTLELSPADRCLNVMPLFHIHGIVAGVLSSLSAGSTIICAPRFDALRFLRWVQQTQPTWFTAVPSIHQSVLALARSHRKLLAEAPLRFIRSCSAPLPQSTLKELELTFGVPVIEAYGIDRVRRTKWPAILCRPSSESRDRWERRPVGK